MSTIPSKQQREAFREVRYDGTKWYGKAWCIAHHVDDGEEWSLWHYGTEILRLEGTQVVRLECTSASDRDGINGLFRLLDLPYTARFPKRGNSILEVTE